MCDLFNTFYSKLGLIEFLFVVWIFCCGRQLNLITGKNIGISLFGEEHITVITTFCDIKLWFQSTIMRDSWVDELTPSLVYFS